LLLLITLRTLTRTEADGKATEEKDFNMDEKEIVRKLSLWAAQRPKLEEAQLMIKAAETICRLRAQLNYEKARAEINETEKEPV
jgi:hypothetical protein